MLAAGVKRDGAAEFRLGPIVRIGVPDRRAAGADAVLAAKLADPLFRLISPSNEPVKIPAALIDAHVDSVRAVVREGVHEANNRTGTEIYERLAKLTDPYLMKAGSVNASLPNIESPKL